MSATVLDAARPQPAATAAAARRREARRAVAPLSLLAVTGLMASTIATTFGLCRVFPDWSFFPRIAIVGIAVHGVCLLGRYRRWNLAVVAAACAATVAVLVGMIYLRGTMAAGVIPTRATWDAAWQSVADSWSQFRVTVAPVPSQGGFGITLALAISMTAFFSDAFAFRAFGRAEAVIPGGLLFIVTSSLGYDRLRLTATAVWLVAAVFTVAMLRAAHGEHSSPWLGSGGPGRRAATFGGAALGVGVAATVAALLVGPHLPGAGSSALVNTRHHNAEGTEVVSPLVDIQARLVNRRNTEMFTVVADSPRYWRLTALESFDGRTWRQDRNYSDADQLASPGSVQGLSQTFRIASLGSIWMPSAFTPASVDSVTSFRFNAELGSLARAKGDLFTGLSYSVVSALPAVSAEGLAASTSSDAPGSVYLQLPDDFPEELRQLARDIVGNASSAYDRAIALQNWFRTNFTYNVNVPRGHSDRAMESFIRQKEGYCEQFAGTYAALARSLGLAARVAIGFTPGDVDTEGVYHVRGKHAHAWPEVWFDGIGWVQFEPTPGRGEPGNEGYTGVPAAQEGGVLTGPADPAGPSKNGDNPSAPTTVAGGTFGSSPIKPDGETGTGTGSTVAPTATLPAATPTGPSNVGSGILVTLLVVLGAFVLWFLAMPPLVRALRSGRVDTNSERLVLAYDNAATALGAAGAARRPEETPAEHAERAWRMTGCDRVVIRRLAELATAAAFGAAEPSDSAVDEGERLSADLVRLLRRRSTWQIRLRHRLDPRLAAIG